MLVEQNEQRLHEAATTELEVLLRMSNRESNPATEEECCQNSRIKGMKAEAATRAGES